MEMVKSYLQQLHPPFSRLAIPFRPSSTINCKWLVLLASCVCLWIQIQPNPIPFIQNVAPVSVSATDAIFISFLLTLFDRRMCLRKVNAGCQFERVAGINILCLGENRLDCRDSPSGCASIGSCLPGVNDPML